jgi:hypothetical protein
MQGNVSRERRKRLTISSNSLSVLANSNQYHRFGLSPISPDVHTSNLDWESLPLRTSLLERYLVEGTHPTPSPRERKVTLASSGIADALPISDVSQRLWAWRSSDDSLSSDVSTPGGNKPLRPQYIFDGNDPNDEQQLEEMDQPKGGQQDMMEQATSASHNSANMSFLPCQKYQTIAKPQFTMDDSGLQTPPPSSFAQSFADQLPQISVQFGSSPFDPPPAPSIDRFPGEFPSSPKISGPSPLDTSLQVARKLDLDSAMNSPVLPEDRTFAVERSLKPPPAPTSGEFFCEGPLHNMRPTASTINATSAKALNNVTNVTKTVLMRPRQDSMISNSSMVNNSRKRIARPSPIPINKTVRFADLRSPAHSQLKSPGLHRQLRSPGLYSHFSQLSSPELLSPITPLAMFCTFSTIVGDSPTMPQGDFSKNLEAEHVSNPPAIEEDANAFFVRGRSHDLGSKKEQPRARSLSPPRSTPLLLSRDTLASLPATVYDPTVIYDAQTNTRTVVYPVEPMVLETKSYTVRNITDNDRTRILKSYFNRASSGI